MTPEQQLVDQILALKAPLAGKRMELSMARNNRIAARVHLVAMHKVIRARRSLRIEAVERAGGCFFVASGDFDRASMKATA